MSETRFVAYNDQTGEDRSIDCACLVGDTWSVEIRPTANGMGLVIRHHGLVTNGGGLHLNQVGSCTLHADVCVKR